MIILHDLTPFISHLFTDFNALRVTFYEVAQDSFFMRLKRVHLKL